MRGEPAQSRLDVEIAEALQGLPPPGMNPRFDAKGYIEDFRRSGQDKAREVVACLDRVVRRYFPAQTPVLVSVGGGDGEEILYLLANTNAMHGVLIEKEIELCEVARTKARELPEGKTLEVLGGDVVAQIGTAMERAASTVRDGKGDCLLVTCHAVIHELFDRSSEEFRPSTFFAAIFSAQDIPTILTYREPGIPKEWPSTVLVEAACKATGLLRIAQALRERHPTLRSLAPLPSIVGDCLMVNRALGMEVLVKLFYLRQLGYELQERSTAVDHQQLEAYLWLAIGDKAHLEGRATMTTTSEPTGSFRENWERLRIRVRGLNADGSTTELTVPENQTRLVALRMPARPEPTMERTILPELDAAEAALKVPDEGMLQAYIISRGRSWVESTERDRALQLLEGAERRFPAPHPIWAWSHYLLGLDQLFTGQLNPVAWFSPEAEKGAERSGLSLLYRAERMESLRKLGDIGNAIHLANDVIRQLESADAAGMTDSDRYVYGTSHFLIANLLRWGSLYEQALTFITKAESIFRPGIPAHDDELAHCYYARALCLSVIGEAPPSSEQFVTRLKPAEMLFADALIKLADSHAFWFVGKLDDARRRAQEAAGDFARIQARSFSERAARLSSLLSLWESLEKDPNARVNPDTTPYGHVIPALIGQEENPTLLRSWFLEQRVSAIVGVLQFARGRKIYKERIELVLPKSLEFSTWVRWRDPRTVHSLEEADTLLRDFLRIPPERRIPLLTDSD